MILLFQFMDELNEGLGCGICTESVMLSPHMWVLNIALIVANTFSRLHGCGHAFCGKCIAHWFRQQKPNDPYSPPNYTCPLCRHNVMIPPTQLNILKPVITCIFDFKCVLGMEMTEGSVKFVEDLRPEMVELFRGMRCTCNNK